MTYRPNRSDANSDMKVDVADMGGVFARCSRTDVHPFPQLETRLSPESFVMTGGKILSPTH